MEDTIDIVSGLIGIVVIIAGCYSCNRVVDEDIKRMKERRIVIDKCIIENKTLPDVETYCKALLRSN